MLEEMGKHGATVHDREAAVVLRAIEQGAREARSTDPGLPEGLSAVPPSPTAYLTLIARLLHANRAAQPSAARGESKAASSIVLP
jgi:hypothetical protein